jgi:CheY-like chemotaxis protein
VTNSLKFTSQGSVVVRIAGPYLTAAAAVDAPPRTACDSPTHAPKLVATHSTTSDSLCSTSPASPQHAAGPSRVHLIARRYASALTLSSVTSLSEEPIWILTPTPYLPSADCSASCVPGLTPTAASGTDVVSLNIDHTPPPHPHSHVPSAQTSSLPTKFVVPGSSLPLVSAAPGAPVGDDKNSVYLMVEDTGLGMSAAELKLIFDPYVQANKQNTGSAPGDYGGTGLGLTIVRSLVQAMGGTITVCSTRGSGSCFVLRLTLPEPTPQQLAEYALHGAAATTPMTLPNHHPDHPSVSHSIVPMSTTTTTTTTATATVTTATTFRGASTSSLQTRLSASHPPTNAALLLPLSSSVLSSSINPLPLSSPLIHMTPSPTSAAAAATTGAAGAFPFPAAAADCTPFNPSFLPPLSHTGSSSSFAQAVVGSVAGATSGTTGPTVLVVDDSAVNRTILQRMLTAGGNPSNYRVLFCSDGKQVVDGSKSSALLSCFLFILFLYLN